MKHWYSGEFSAKPGTFIKHIFKRKNAILIIRQRFKKNFIEAILFFA